MDSLPAMRGNFVPTHLSARCSAFHMCNICTGCTKYDPHSVLCGRCQERVETVCHHTDDQRVVIRMMTDLLKQPMMHPDKVSGEISVPVAENQAYEDAVEVLGKLGLGTVQVG